MCKCFSTFLLVSHLLMFPRRKQATEPHTESRGGVPDFRSKIILQRICTQWWEEFVTILQPNTQFYNPPHHSCVLKIRKDDNSKVWEIACQAEYWHMLCNSISRNTASCTHEELVCAIYLATLVLTAEVINNSNVHF